MEWIFEYNVVGELGFTLNITLHSSCCYSWLLEIYIETAQEMEVVDVGKD